MSVPELEIACVAALTDFESFALISNDDGSLTFDICGPTVFLRRAESKLLRGSNPALLHGRAIKLQRASWTQPVDSTTLRVCCRFAQSNLGV